MSVSALAHLSQLLSELVVDGQIDEEVADVVHFKGVAQVAVDGPEPVVRVESGEIGHHITQEQTEANLHGFLVGRFLLGVRTGIKRLYTVLLNTSESQFNILILTCFPHVGSPSFFDPRS